jgi:hypothetical protein
MIAPISSRPCYYYRTLVWEWKQRGRNKSWVKVAGECMHLPFFLDDNTGKVMVDPRGADLDLHRDFQQEFSDSFFTTDDPVPDNVRGFLARHGIQTRNKIKVEEYCIKPKNALFILGTLSDNPGLEVKPQPIHDAEAATLGAGNLLSFSLPSSLSFSSGTDRDSEDSRLMGRLLAQPANAVATPGNQPQVVRLSSSSSAAAASMTQQEKVAAALLKAGITNPAAWAAAGVAAPGLQVNGDPLVLSGSGVNSSGSDSSPGGASASPQTAQNYANTRPDGFDQHPPTVLMKGTNNPTFLISWRSQQDVARSLGWKCALMIWGGPALALLSLYVLLAVTNSL